MFVKYHELQLSVIPVEPRKKKPVHLGWSKWCHQLPSRQECEEWDIQYKDGNFGLACGEASRVIVVDIDNDEFNSICPESPVVRGGKPNRQSRFFRFSADQNIRSEAFTKPGEENPSVEILSTGRQCVLPPSIHPDTQKPYFWISHDTLENFDVNDLPILTEDQVNKIRNAVLDADLQTQDFSPKPIVGENELFINTDPMRSSPTGSQNRIKTECARLIQKCLPVDTAVKMLLEFDQQHHQGPYFEDQSRSDCRADPRTNAYKFYTNLMSYVNSQRARKNEPLLLPPEYKNVELQKITPKKKKEAISFPKPEGVMGRFMDYCEMCATSTASSQLALGSALCFMSALSANRVWAKIDQYTVTPNLYVLNLAPSGTGKEIVQKLITDLLSKSGENLLGSTMYRSGTSIIKGLPRQQNRIDIIDEASGLLKAMGGDSTFQAEMVEILCTLFSKASSFYSGAQTAQHETPVGACHQPHVTILASTTLAGFQSSVTKEVAIKGLLPRFMTFYQREKGRLNKSFNPAIEKSILFELHEFVRKFFYLYNLKELPLPVNLLAPQTNPKFKEVTVSVGKLYEPHVLSFSEEAAASFRAFREVMFYESASSDEGFDEAFKNRFAELAAKCAMLHCLSREGDVIELKDMEWGIAIVRLQWQNCSNIYQLARAESLYQEACLFFLGVIEKNGGPIRAADLCKRTQKYAKIRDAVLKELIDTEQIEPATSEVISSSRGPKPVFYQIRRVGADNAIATAFR